jgi:predicted permease
MDALLQNLRYAFRSLARQPLLVVVVVASLGLGIGANTTIYSLANAFLLRPVPAQHPEELVAVYTSESSGELYGSTSHPAYLEMRDRNPALSSLAAYTVAPMSLTVNSHSQRLIGALVSGNYFTMLGAAPGHGRLLLPADDAPEAAAVVVVSHGLWTRRFGSNPELVGSRLMVNGHPFQVVGILRPDFLSAVMGVTPDLFVPLSATPLANPGSDRLEQRGGRWLFLMGRLAPDQKIGAVRARMNTIAREMGAQYPNTDSARVISVLPESQARLHPRIKGPVTAFMALLATVVALVLLVACANVAGLMLARATTRRREVGVRLALGASRGQIMSQFLVESLVLALLGGAAGWVLAAWGTDLLLAFKPPLPLDVPIDVRPDGRVLLFTLILSVVTGVLFGLVPALEALRVDPAPAIHEGAQGGLRRSRLRSALVVGQVAVSLLLLIGAGLLVRALGRASQLDPGFEVNRTLALSFDLRLHGYDDAKGQGFYRDLLERVRALPQVEAAALDEHLPLGLGSQRSGLAIQGYTPAPREHIEIAGTVVSTGYFETLGIPIVSGRPFDDSDRAGGARVAIVNQAFARRFWPGQEAVGKRINLDTNGGDSTWIEVVGVAGTIKYHNLAEDPLPFFYVPFAQAYGPAMTLVARVTRDPARELAAMRGVVRSLDDDLPVFDAKTMTEHLGITLYPVRLASTVLGAIGVLALLLAAIGLYGVVAYAVSQRTREIGVRMALGARPLDVLRLIVSHGMRLAGVGLAIGLVLALAVTRLVTGLLYGVSPTDPVTLVAIGALLLSVTLLASWIPARRAARVDPMVALRHE